MATRKKPVVLPRIGPCHDPLALWFLEFRAPENGQVMRTYHADRTEARAALKLKRAGTEPVADKALDVDRLLLIFHDLDHQLRQVHTTMDELRAEMQALRRQRKGN